MNLHQFYFDAIVRARKTHERYGQAMFNHLVEVRPDLSDGVRGTSMDPFYVNTPMDPRFDAFCQYIETHWRS